MAVGGPRIRNCPIPGLRRRYVSLGSARAVRGGSSTCLAQKPKDKVASPPAIARGCGPPQQHCCATGHGDRRCANLSPRAISELASCVERKPLLSTFRRANGGLRAWPLIATRSDSARPVDHGPASLPRGLSRRSQQSRLIRRDERKAGDCSFKMRYLLTQTVSYNVQAPRPRIPSAEAPQLLRSARVQSSL